MADLPPLPTQPTSVPWPGLEWPTAAPGADVDITTLESSADRAFDPPDPEIHGETYAWLFVQGGRIVYERYAEGKDASETFISWSMAKSIVHALVGVLVGEGKLDPAAPAPVPAWHGAGDPRGGITLENLLRMVDGLDFVEEYEEGRGSDVIEMLFKTGKTDVAAYASARPTAHRPGTWWNYSSGTSNIVSAIVGRCVGGGEAGMRDFMQRVLFDAIGMKSATSRFDEAGTFIGSSYVFATARDFARFGLLYLRDGIWEGERLLPTGWVDQARTLTPASSGWYGAHWWHALHDPGIFHAAGFNGQYIACDPSRDLVMVRLGLSNPVQRIDVMRGLRAAAESFPTIDG